MVALILANSIAEYTKIVNGISFSILIKIVNHNFLFLSLYLFYLYLFKVLLEQAIKLLYLEENYFCGTLYKHQNSYHNIHLQLFFYFPLPSAITIIGVNFLIE